MKTHEFKIPGSFEKYIDEYEVARKEQLEEVERQRKREENKKSRQREDHKKKAERDLPYAKAIFEWVAEFRASPAGKRAIALLPASSRPDNLLTFFEWHPGWGYSLDMTDRGIRWYRFGPGSQEKYCQTPKELATWCAQNESTGMLKAASKTIESGEVWEWIKKDLDLFIGEERR